MRKLMNKLNFAIVGMMASGSAMAATIDTNFQKAMCDLAIQLGGVFSMLRTLAFVGAAFIIAGWAWGWISGGKEVEVKDVKSKGLGMLIGFIALFSVGVIIQAFMTMTGEGGSYGCIANAF